MEKKISVMTLQRNVRNVEERRIFAGFDSEEDAIKWAKKLKNIVKLVFFNSDNKIEKEIYFNRG